MLNSIAKFIGKHTWLFYILNLTWGLLINIAGLFTFIFLKITGQLEKESNKYLNKRYFRFKKLKNYSFNLGIFVFAGNSNQYTLEHEIGHGIQNAIYGPFSIFIVYIPSAIRYAWRDKQAKKGKKLITGYYDIWFEAQASSWGSTWNFSKKFTEGIFKELD